MLSRIIASRRSRWALVFPILVAVATATGTSAASTSSGPAPTVATTPVPPIDPTKPSDLPAVAAPESTEPATVLVERIKQNDPACDGGIDESVTGEIRIRYSGAISHASRL